MQKGPGHGVPPAMSAIKESVQIGQESVADGKVVPGGIQQQRVGSKGGRILGLEGRKMLQLSAGHPQQKYLENSRPHSSQLRVYFLKDLEAWPLISTVGQREIISPSKWPFFTLKLSSLHPLFRGAL